MIKIRLKERDGASGGNNDKDLGVQTKKSTEPASHGQAVFATDGVSYTLDYRITVV